MVDLPVPVTCPICELTDKLNEIKLNRAEVSEGYRCGNCNNIFIIVGEAKRYTWTGLDDGVATTHRLWALTSEQAEDLATQGDRVFKTVAIYEGWHDDVQPGRRAREAEKA